MREDLEEKRTETFGAGLKDAVYRYKAMKLKLGALTLKSKVH